VAEKTFILVSVPNEFSQKFMGMINNINALSQQTELPVKIEKVYKRNTDHAVVPKEKPAVIFTQPEDR